MLGRQREQLRRRISATCGKDIVAKFGGSCLGPVGGFSETEAMRDEKGAPRLSQFWPPRLAAMSVRDFVRGMYRTRYPTYKRSS